MIAVRFTLAGYSLGRSWRRFESIQTQTRQRGYVLTVRYATGAPWLKV